MDLKEEDILGDKIYDHWYYVAKGRAMLDMLGQFQCDEVLDVGAGSGIFSKTLLDHDICQSAVCVDSGYPKEWQENHHGKNISFVKSQSKTSQNLILMMDVLEHVPDDTALLKQYTDSMSKGGKVLITVPAFQFLWSGHDVFLEHYRRYTISMIEDLVKNAGLKPVKSRYFFGSLFPIIAAMRVGKNLITNRGIHEPKSDMKLYPDWLNKSLISIHRVEQKILFPVNKIAGLSVFCLCEKE